MFPFMYNGHTHCVHLACVKMHVFFMYVYLCAAHFCVFECFVYVTISVCLSAINNDSICCQRHYLTHQLNELTSLFNEMTTLVEFLTSGTPDWAAPSRKGQISFLSKSFFVSFVSAMLFIPLTVHMSHLLSLSTHSCHFYSLMSSTSLLFTLQSWR